MGLKQYFVSAFIGDLSKGNQAAVCILDNWLEDELLQKIAGENNLPSTAFVLKRDSDLFQIRFFTPDSEIDLCENAALASAHIIRSNVLNNITFYLSSISEDIKVNYADESYSMNLLSHPPSFSIQPEVINSAIKFKPKKILKCRDYIFIYEQEQQVRMLSPTNLLMDSTNIGPKKIIVTSKGEKSDFVSKLFLLLGKNYKESESGVIHNSLTPYWSKELGKNKMIARRLSERGGFVQCGIKNNKVVIGGKAKTYFRGTIFINKKCDT